jgi:hypothetical protein
MAVAATDDALYVIASVGLVVDVKGLTDAASLDDAGVKVASLQFLRVLSFLSVDVCWVL